MQVLRSLALIAFLAGAGMLVAGFVVRSGEADDPKAAQQPRTFDIVAPPTPTRTPTVPPPEGTIAPTPTPTPPPYDGPVARLKIPRFGVDSKIEEIGFKAGTQNQLDTPHDPHNTGWYKLDGYGKPGFGSNSLFSAHVDYFPNILGPFNKLAESEIGDEIVVTMGNGEEYHYRVVRRARYDVDNVPMGELIWPESCSSKTEGNPVCKPDEAEWITLITCGGEFRATSKEGYGEYLQRDVVVAERITS